MLEHNTTVMSLMCADDSVLQDEFQASTRPPFSQFALREGNQDHPYQSNSHGYEACGSAVQFPLQNASDMAFNCSDSSPSPHSFDQKSNQEAMFGGEQQHTCANYNLTTCQTLPNGRQLSDEGVMFAYDLSASARDGAVERWTSQVKLGGAQNDVHTQPTVPQCQM